MIIRESWNPIYLVKFESAPLFNEEFDSESEAMAYATEHIANKPIVESFNAYFDAFGCVEKESEHKIIPLSESKEEDEDDDSETEEVSLEDRLVNLENAVSELDKKVKDVVTTVSETEPITDDIPEEEISETEDEDSDVDEYDFLKDKEEPTEVPENPFDTDFSDISKDEAEHQEVEDSYIDDWYKDYDVDSPEAATLVVMADIPADEAEKISDPEVKVEIPTVTDPVDGTVIEKPAEEISDCHPCPECGEEICECNKDLTDKKLNEAGPKDPSEEVNATQDLVDGEADEFEKHQKIADDFRNSQEEDLKEDWKSVVNDIVNGWESEKPLEEASSSFKKAFKNGGDDYADYIDGRAIASVKDKDERDRLVAMKRLEKKDKLGDRVPVEKELTHKEGQAVADYEKKANAAKEAGLKDAEDEEDDLTGKFVPAYFKLKESQSQEIRQIYDNLAKKYGVDVEDLVYGVDGFYYNVYPTYWNETFSSFYNTKAPGTDTKKPTFNGDLVYDPKSWKEFEDWCKKAKGIDLSDDASESWTDEELAEELAKAFEEKRK